LEGQLSLGCGGILLGALVTFVSVYFLWPGGDHARNAAAGTSVAIYLGVLSTVARIFDWRATARWYRLRAEEAAALAASRSPRDVRIVEVSAEEFDESFPRE
jgi:hypothetical protein